MSFKSGFISIIGAPNVGKSTLLNAILGEKVSIVSRRPQTTRNTIRGVKNVGTQENGCQMIFIDTPGMHRAKGALNAYMVKEALASLEDVDCVAFVIDATSKDRSDEELVLENLGRVSAPVLLLINKIDLIAKGALLPLIEKYSKKFVFKEIIPLSAEKGDNVERFVNVVTELMPEGPEYFPPDITTDQPERFIVAEIVREKIFRLTHEEIPYSVAVVTEEFEERKGKDLVAIRACISVERDSQKGVIIGKGGEMIKRIGTAAREDMERLLGVKVFLDLNVKVTKGWTKDSRAMKEFGYE